MIVGPSTPPGVLANMSHVLFEASVIESALWSLVKSQGFRFVAMEVAQAGNGQKATCLPRLRAPHGALSLEHFLRHAATKSLPVPTESMSRYRSKPKGCAVNGLRHRKLWGWALIWAFIPLNLPACPNTHGTRPIFTTNFGAVI